MRLRTACWLPGVEPGDRVGILALNRVEFLEVLFGAMRAGCVPVMINVKLPDETVEYIVQDAEMKAVFADPNQAERVPDGVRTLTFPKRWGTLRQGGITRQQ